MSGFSRHSTHAMQLPRLSAPSHARPTLLAVLVLAACTSSKEASLAPPTVAVTGHQTLAAPAAFSALPKEQRAAALFVEASKVLTHPRCTNCHPPDDRPRQRAGEPHEPPVERGPDDHGIVLLRCDSCHQDHNLTHARVPGAPKWGLAQRQMVWLGRTPAQICAQLKDSQRNGKKTLAEIVEHAAHDPLVAWGWAPGQGREPAPGTQAQFGALIAAWAEAGAHCPQE